MAPQKPTLDPAPYQWRVAALFLLLLFGADFVFGLLHIVHSVTPWLPEREFSVTGDRTFAECFQYIKEFWIVGMLCVLIWLTGEKRLLVWVALFGYFFCDDAGRGHEYAGVYLDAHFELPTILTASPNATAEIIYFGTVATLWLLAIVSTYRKGSPSFRRFSEDLIVLLAVVAFFAVAVDLLHGIVYGMIPDGGNSGLNVAIGLLEDGGEMFTLSVITTYVMLATIHQIGHQIGHQLGHQLGHPRGEFQLHPTSGFARRLWEKFWPSRRAV